MLMRRTGSGPVLRRRPWLLGTFLLSGTIAGCSGSIETAEGPAPGTAPGEAPRGAPPVNTAPGASPRGGEPGERPVGSAPGGPAATAPARCDLAGQGRAPAPQRVWLLTPEQLPPTVASVYGDGPKGPALEVVTPGNRTFLGNDADLLKLNGEQVRGLVSGTEAMAKFMADKIDQYAKCAIETPACFDTFMTELATRAWRTPPTAQQLARLRAVYTVGAEVSAREGYRLALTAVLKSPRFIYRTEIGTPEGKGTFRLTPWETAAQLSYFLLNAPPDAPLRQLAASGAIREPQVYEKEAERLLRDPRARGLAGRFLAQLTAADSLTGVTKDNPGPLGFGDDVTAALLDELRLFSEWIFFDADATVGDLLTRPETFVNQTVAAFYGAGVKGGREFAKVSLAGTPRTGLLSMPAVMATHAQTDHVVPTTRGRFVFEKLLCTSIPNPPQFEADLPAASPSLTPRKRLEVMKDYPACSGCHNLLDPVGFAFDNFDHVGRYVKTVGGVPVDPSGYIKGSAGADGSFDDLPGLARLLASSEHVRRCVHRQFIQHAQGRAIGAEEACALESSFRAFEASGGKLSALVRAALTVENLHVRGAAR
jgi:hypothetical protein